MFAHLEAHADALAAPQVEVAAAIVAAAEQEADEFAAGEVAEQSKEPAVFGQTVVVVIDGVVAADEDLVLP